MSQKPKNFSQALDELEAGMNAATESGDFRARVEGEMHRLQNILDSLKPHLSDLGNHVGDEAAKAKKKVETKVQENPWAAVGIVGLIAFVVGFLFASRRRD